MSYTARLRIEVPAALYDTACAIARALDVDVGGASSFGPREQGDPPAIPETYSTETPCTPAFAEQAIAMIGNPAMLHAVVAADYAARWADLTCPSMEDCQAFCAGATVTDTTKETQCLLSSQESASGPLSPGLSDPMTTTST